MIKKLDIDIQLCLEKCKDDEILGKLLKDYETDRKNFRKEKDLFNVEFRTTIDSLEINMWTESINVADNLNQVRMKTIEELRKAHEERLEYYKLNSNQNNTYNLTQLLWHFNLFTFATDFYISQSDINLLE